MSSRSEEKSFPTILQTPLYAVRPSNGKVQQQGTTSNTLISAFYTIHYQLITAIEQIFHSAQETTSNVSISAHM